MMNLAFCFPKHTRMACNVKHTYTCGHTRHPPVSFALHRAMRIRASMCHQNEGRKYAKQTIRGVPPGAKQPIMAVPVCVTSQQEAELVLVSSQSPAEWLISLLY